MKNIYNLLTRLLILLLQDYCEYKQICNFKENNNCSYRYIENLKKEEILESIRKEKEE